MISAIREFICFNQKQTIKYEYIISEKHKKLKIFCEENQNKKDNDFLSELNKMYDDFVIDSYTSMLVIFEENKNLVNNMFFALNKNTPPRIIIKTLQGRDKVLNFYRSTSIANFELSSIKGNSGFSEILNNDSLYYLNNNIPESFKKSTYSNPRLSKDKQKNFKRGTITWQKCWKDFENNDSFEYYSSTLIIPMSIRSDSSDKNDVEFYKHFFQDVEQHANSRTIWGFLCFDHQEINYFKNNNDELTDIGYIIADILSLYMMYFYNHITGSKTIKDIEKILFD